MVCLRCTQSSIKPVCHVSHNVTRNTGVFAVKHVAQKIHRQSAKVVTSNKGHVPLIRCVAPASRNLSKHSGYWFKALPSVNIAKLPWDRDMKEPACLCLYSTFARQIPANGGWLCAQFYSRRSSPFEWPNQENLCLQLFPPSKNAVQKLHS